jgi:hypothetical protein
VGAWYEAQYGEPADLADFVATLHELSFVRPSHERPRDLARLVTDGIELLDRELADGQHKLHRSVLHHNRARSWPPWAAAQKPWPSPAT